MRLQSLWYPKTSLHLLSLFTLRMGKVSAACSCCWTYSHWTDGLEWTGRCHACCPPRARGVYSLAYLTRYWILQGIGASYKVIGSKQLLLLALQVRLWHAQIQLKLNWPQNETLHQLTQPASYDLATSLFGVQQSLSMTEEKIIMPQHYWAGLPVWLNQQVGSRYQSLSHIAGNFKLPVEPVVCLESSRPPLGVAVPLLCSRVITNLVYPQHLACLCWFRLQARLASARLPLFGRYYL